MYCKKCSGNVFIDQVFSEYSHVELFCIQCGKRWMVDKSGVFGHWLMKQTVTT